MRALGMLSHLDPNRRWARLTVLAKLEPTDADVSDFTPERKVFVPYLPDEFRAQTNLVVGFECREDSTIESGSHKDRYIVGSKTLTPCGYVVYPCPEAAWFGGGRPALPIHFAAPSMQKVIIETTFDGREGYVGPWRCEAGQWRSDLDRELLFWDQECLVGMQESTILLYDQSVAPVSVWLELPPWQAGRIDACDNKQLANWFTEQLRALEGDVLDQLTAITPEWQQRLSEAFRTQGDELANQRWQNVKSILSTITLGKETSDLLDSPALRLALDGWLTRDGNIRVDSSFLSALPERKEERGIEKPAIKEAARQSPEAINSVFFPNVVYQPPEVVAPGEPLQDERLYIEERLIPCLARRDCDKHLVLLGRLLHCALLKCRGVRVPHPGWTRAYTEAMGGRAVMEIVVARPTWTGFASAWEDGFADFWLSAARNPDALHLLHIDELNLSMSEAWMGPVLHILAGFRETLPGKLGGHDWPENLRLIVSADEDTEERFSLGRKIPAAFPALCKAGDTAASTPKRIAEGMVLYSTWRSWADSAPLHEETEVDARRKKEELAGLGIPGGLIPLVRKNITAIDTHHWRLYGGDNRDASYRYARRMCLPGRQAESASFLATE